MKILIVDDEKKICESIKRFICTNHFPVQEVYTTDVSSEAYRIVKQCHPDIVISDVVMPNMDGIELARKIKDFDPYIHIILVSGYGDIRYIKSAFKINAVDYILKPVDIGELTATLDRVIEQYLEKKSQKKLQLETNVGTAKVQLRSFLSGDIKFADMEAYLSYLGLYEGRYATIVCLTFQGKQETEIMQHMIVLLEKICSLEFCTVIQIQNKLALVLTYKGMVQELHSYAKNTIEELRRHIDGIVFAVGIGDCVRELELLPLVWCHAQDAAINSYTSQNCEIVFFKDQENEILADFSITRDQHISIFHAIYLAKPEELDRMIDRIDLSIREIRNLNHKLLEKIRFELLGLVARTIKEVNSGDRGTVYELKIEIDEFLKLILPDDMMVWLRYILHSVYDAYQAGGKYNSNVVKQIKEVVRTEFINPSLTVQYIAEKIGVGPNYLSACFKNAMGIRLNEYITDHRLEYAKKLMEDPGKKLGEVGEMVGFDDQNYFSRVFKKHNGYTPSEYREMILCSQKN